MRLIDALRGYGTRRTGMVRRDDLRDVERPEHPRVLAVVVVAAVLLMVVALSLMSTLR